MRKHFAHSKVRRLFGSSSSSSTTTTAKQKITRRAVGFVAATLLLLVSIIAVGGFLGASSPSNGELMAEPLYIRPLNNHLQHTGGGGDGIDGAIRMIRTALYEVESELDNYIAQYNSRRGNKENQEENLMVGGKAGASASVGEQSALGVSAPTPQQLERLQRQKDYLTVRYDRTSFTPYAPSITEPYGSGLSFASSRASAAALTPLQSSTTTNILTSLQLVKKKHARRGPHWHRRQWAIPHPRHDPAIISERQRLTKGKTGGHLPAALVTPENGDSIFVSIASYRDEQCAPTIHDMFLRAKHPENIYVGVVQQHDNDDRGGPDASCIPPQFGRAVLVGGVAGGAADGNQNTDYSSRGGMRRKMLQEVTAFHARGIGLRRGLLLQQKKQQDGESKSNNNPYSSWRQGGRSNGAGCQHDFGFCPTDNIRTRHILPKHSKGPTFGRYVGFLMYRGEQFVFMMDSHNRFVSHWDALVVSMYKTLQREQKVTKPVLSHYPEAWDNPADSKDGKDNNRPLDGRGTTAFLCKANFLEWGIPRLEGIVIAKPPRPLPQPFAAAGFLFADGAIVREVPFDPHLDFVFDGEEITYSIRMFTHGWNMFSPTENVIFHYYYRKSAKRFWGLVPANYNERRAVSEKRIQYLVGATKKGTSDSFLIGEDISSEVKAFFHVCNGNPYCFLRLQRAQETNVPTTILASMLLNSPTNGNMTVIMPKVLSKPEDILEKILKDAKAVAVTAAAATAHRSGEGGKTNAILSYNAVERRLRLMNNIGRYGMGTVRSVEDWWAYSGMDRKSRKANHIKFCQFLENQRRRSGDYFEERYD